MKKKIMCLAMIALMVIGTPISVNAEDYVSSNAWEVSFDGKQISSNFKTSQVAEDVLNILPGDSITIKINLKDASGNKSDWYLKSDILQTLEDSNNSASGGAYTYILKYHGPKETGEGTVLYSSETVGGDKADGGKEGLREAADSLESYVYLDRISHGEQAYVSLYVKLDGETQGNDYQKTLAKLQMNFAVEKVKDGTVEKHIVEKKNKEVVTYVTDTRGMVKTGDSSDVVFFSTVTLVSGFALLTIAIVAMKNRRQEKGE